MSEETTGLSKIEGLIGRIRAERARGGKLRLIVFGIALVIVIAFIVSTYSRIKNFDVDTFMVNLQKQGAKALWPVISSELDDLAKEVGPAIGDAFSKESRNIGQKVVKVLEDEAEILNRDLRNRMADAIEKSFSESLGKEKDKIAALKAFRSNPDLMDELFTKIKSAGREWAFTQLDTTFSRHVKLLQSINETVHEFQRQARRELKEDERKGEPAIQVEDILQMFIEILNTRLEGGR